MFLAVYTRGLEQGITTMEAIESDGISAYMGTAPCNQVANGLYLRLDGRVQMCPGTSRQATVFGNVHEASIIDIWKGSSSYRMGATLNNWCTAKVNGMPYWIQEEVLHDLKRDHPQTAPERVKPYMTAV
jgi:hypothetical protein